MKGITRLTVTHELEGAPIHAEQVVGLVPLAQGGGGWPWILSDLKTLLETGTHSAAESGTAGTLARDPGAPRLGSFPPPRWEAEVQRPVQTLACARHLSQGLESRSPTERQNR